MIGRRRIRTLSALALVASIAGPQALPATPSELARRSGCSDAPGPPRRSRGRRQTGHGRPQDRVPRQCAAPRRLGRRCDGALRNRLHEPRGGRRDRARSAPAHARDLPVHGDRSGFAPADHNADGSLDIYTQPNPPVDPQQRCNWLPSPAGAAFWLIMRLYAPTDVRGILSGATWQPPTVLPCLTDGRTSAGISCASG
jgi:hypothetical protein